MKTLKIKKELGGRLVYFVAYYECGKNSDEIQIRIKIPHVRQQSSLNWKFRTKDINLLNATINRFNDKQKVFTEEYFNKFVNMFMKAITKKNALLLVSEDTELSSFNFFEEQDDLDSITRKNFFLGLKNNNWISDKLSPFYLRRRIKIGLEPIKVKFPNGYDERINIQLEILKNK